MDQKKSKKEQLDKLETILADNKPLTLENITEKYPDIKHDIYKTEKGYSSLYEAKKDLMKRFIEQKRTKDMQKLKPHIREKRRTEKEHWNIFVEHVKKRDEIDRIYLDIPATYRRLISITGSFTGVLLELKDKYKNDKDITKKVTNYFNI